MPLKRAAPDASPSGFTARGGPDLPSAPTPAMAERGQRAGGHRFAEVLGSLDRPAIAVLIAAVAAGVVAMVLSQTVFSHLSVNDDESVYLLQARALAHGHLFPPAPKPASSFTPWLGVLRGGHYVMKYLPTLPAAMALSLLLTGGLAGLMACSAAGLVLATFSLGKRTIGNRREAAIGAVLTAASPLVLVQSGLALPYLPFLLLIVLAWSQLLAGSERVQIGRFALAGLCAGLAFTMRPFDAILLLSPALGWLLLRGPTCRRSLLTGLFAGGLVPAVAMLWYDLIATGSPLKLPFSLFSPQDKLGFGVRRLYPGETARHFGLSQGWQGLLRHLSLLAGGWAFGGVILAALALLGWRRRSPSAGLLSVFAGSAFLAVGYLFFWGTWNASILWGGTRYLGPYYLMPLLIPTTLLAAVGLVAVAVSSRLWLALVTIAAGALSGSTLAGALNANAAINADNGQLAAAIVARGKGLFFVQTYPAYLQHPTAVISNTSPVGGLTVYALDSANNGFAVMRTFPHRALYRLRLLGEYGHTPHKFFGARIEHLRIVTGQTLTFDVDARIPRSVSDAQLIVVKGTYRHTIALKPNDLNRLRLVISATENPDLPQPPGVLVMPALTGGPDGITVVLRARTKAGHRISDQLPIPLMSTSARVAALAADGQVAELGPLPPPALTVTFASAQ